MAACLAHVVKRLVDTRADCAVQGQLFLSERRHSSVVALPEGLHHEPIERVSDQAWCVELSADRKGLLVERFRLFMFPLMLGDPGERLDGGCKAEPIAVVREDLDRSLEELACASVLCPEARKISRETEQPAKIGRPLDALHR